MTFVVLLESTAITSIFVSDPDKKRFTTTCDEHIVLFVDSYTIFYENRYGSVVGSFVHTHQFTGPVILIPFHHGATQIEGEENMSLVSYYLPHTHESNTLLIDEVETKAEAPCKNEIETPLSDCHAVTGAKSK
jgi:hypothetical protein